MTREAFDAAMSLGYRDRFGFPVDRRGQTEPSGNCLMFLGEEMIIRRDLGRHEAIEDVVRLAELAGLCEIQPGNYRRTPAGCGFSYDQEGWDDYVGLTAAATVMIDHEPVVCLRLFAMISAIVLFGEKHFFRWGPFRFRNAWPTPPGLVAPDETKDARAWFGRYPQFMAHLRWCSGGKPNLFQRLVWCWSVAFAGFFDRDGQDPWRLTYLLVRARRSRPGAWLPERLAERIWRFRFLKRWPGGIGEVRAAYFQDVNHPLAKYAGMEF
jgi:hypothetical protein